MPERNVQPVSDAVEEMALQLEREFGIRPLGADEERADDAYAVGHYTGSPKLREC